MKLPILGEMSRKKSIALGVALALMLLLMFPVTTTDDMSESFEESSEEDNTNVSGTFDAYAELKDNTGDTVWSQGSAGASDMYDMPQSILDPVSGKTVTGLVMGVTWVATGHDLDWDTMKVWSRFWFWSYAGNGGGKDYHQVLEDKEVLGPDMEFEVDPDLGIIAVRSGIEFRPADLESHMPDTVVMVFRAPGETGAMETWTEEYPQTTIEPHPMTFTYRARYWVSVFDIYGNEFTGDYTQMTVLDLQWSGTGFDIEWGGEQETATTTSVAPTMDGLPDYSAVLGSAFTLVWSPRDSDNDPASFEITVDKVLKSSGAWTGGDVSYSTKYVTGGVRVVVITVTDTAGNTATDTVRVSCFEEFGEDEIIGVDPTQTTDARSELETGTTDEATPKDTGAMSGLGGMAGSQEGILLLAIVAAVAFIAYKPDTLKVIRKKIKI